jgi:DNA-directed RNA polymerase sigma subunit (sigma70/sigma32)
MEDIDLYEDGNDGAADVNPDDAYEAITPAEMAREKTAEGLLNFIKPDDAVGLYFRDVRPIPLLDHEQEIELGKQIERRQQAEKLLHRDHLTLEERALHKLRHPHRSERLRIYLD